MSTVASGTRQASTGRAHEAFELVFGSAYVADDAVVIGFDPDQRRGGTVLGGRCA
ncbi:hypothetical protein [uncultured Cellulomonas sp.]|uniref:hypothetical protein n=1 Tax=uncultured Cellulomonas sp. TaxID=189682 RepID=UPI002620CAB9|nr:hypothetical protein [uncultured Cellulomonas sp.]